MLLVHSAGKGRDAPKCDRDLMLYTPGSSEYRDN